MRNVTWRTFRAKLAKWRETQRKFMPAFADFVQDDVDNVFGDDEDEEDDNSEGGDGPKPEEGDGSLNPKPCNCCRKHCVVCHCQVLARKNQRVGPTCTECRDAKVLCSLSKEVKKKNVELAAAHFTICPIVWSDGSRPTPRCWTG